jgi:hypothetical protein
MWEGSRTLLSHGRSADPSDTLEFAPIDHGTGARSVPAIVSLPPALPRPDTSGFDVLKQHLFEIVTDGYFAGLATFLIEVKHPLLARMIQAAV